MSREAAYSAVQRTAMKVWDEGDESFRALLGKDAEVSSTLAPEHLDALFDYSFYTGKVDTILARLED